MIRREYVDAAAWAAWCRLLPRQRSVLQSRLAGEPYSRIAKRQGCSRQAVCVCEQTAIRRLCASAGRAVMVSCLAVLASAAAELPPGSEYLGGNSRGRPGPRPQWARLQAELDQITDEFLAGGPVDEDRARAIEEALFNA